MPMGGGGGGYSYMGPGGYEHRGGQSGLGNDQFVIDRDYARLKMQDDTQKKLAGDQLAFQRDKFNKATNLIGNAMGNGAATFSAVGGTNTPLPKLPNDYVWSADQTQQAVNAARAQGDQQTAQGQKRLGGELAGRGFGSNSPLAMAFRQGITATGNAQNADQERGIRLGNAQADAQQALGVGGLANQQWQGWNNADIERRRLQTDSILSSQRNNASLIAALSGLA